MLVYFIKSAACMAIFLLFYKLLLEKENMHVFKRFYLLGALVASLVIPSLVFVEYVEPLVVNTTITPTQGTYTPIEIEQTASPSDMDMINFSLLFTMIYALGFLIFGFRFIKNLFQIVNRIRKNAKLKIGFITKVLLQEKMAPHTFFKYIFLNKSKFESNAIPKEVLLHEETHAKQRHSLDVIFVELLQVVLWFNPLVYFFKKSIKLNHEFLADQAVIKKEIDKTTYQNTLLSYLSPDSEKKYQPQLANAINYSSIKKRFTIMKTHTSKKAVLLRSLLLLPLLALMLYGFSETKLIEQESGAHNSINEDPAKIESQQINYSQGEQSIIAEDINIYINKKGELLLEDKLVTLEEFKKYLSEINLHLSLEQKQGIVRSTIYVDIDSPKRTIDTVNKILTEYGSATINIVGPNTDSIHQKGASRKLMDQYNSLAKKYNAIPIENRKIPISDLKVLETVYRKMNTKQKVSSQPFPECLPKNAQDGASRKLMAEYNVLAKKYNTMLAESKSIQIKKKDVERLEYIYGLMSDKQKADAEPFPDFPEPPPPPKAPKAPKATKAPKVKKGEKSDIPPPPPSVEEIEEVIELEEEAEMQEQEVLMEKQEAKLVEQEILMEKEEVKLEQEEILMVQQESKMQEQKAELEEIEKETERVYRIKRGMDSNIPEPPIPSEPMEPLDHVIEMAKKDATFYFEGKKISSDKAIELLKKNKAINVDSRGSKGTKPVIRLSTKPIKIGHKSHKIKSNNSKSKSSVDLKKVELVSMMSNEGLQRKTIAKRVIYFSENFRNCSEYFFDGKAISEKEALDIYVRNEEILITTVDYDNKGLIIKC